MNDPRFPPVQRHAQMSQIPGMLRPTSDVQGHGEGEPEGFARAYRNSLVLNHAAPAGVGAASGAGAASCAGAGSAACGCAAGSACPRRGATPGPSRTATTKPAAPSTDTRGGTTSPACSHTPSKRKCAGLLSLWLPPAESAPSARACQ